MFSEVQIQAIEAAADQLKVEAAAIMAVVEVESGGQVYARVGGRDEPLIRIEGHYFYRLINPVLRDDAVRLGLASPKAGAVKNPNSQAARYAMLERMSALDEEAALMSCSWGIGQVMGEHWKWLGYDSVNHMEDVCRRGFGGQLEVMLRFISKSGLMDEMRRHDWAGFARVYNGPAYARYGYHTKIKAAYERRSGGVTSVSSASGMLRLGSKGLRVREVQTLLRRSGVELNVDGDFGPATRDAVKAFQTRQGLQVDGVVGPETMARLGRFRQSTQEQPGAQAVADIPDVKKGVGAGIGGAVTIETAKQSIDSALTQTAGVESLEWLTTTLTVLATVVALAGIAWAVRGYLKSRQTVEQPGAVE